MLLKQINSSGNVLGIQKLPKALVNVQGGSNVTGLLMEKCDRDYFDDIYIKSSIDDRLMEMYQLLFGLSHLKQQGIVHGDIKPENILVKTVDRVKFVTLADFAGARNTKLAQTAKDVSQGCKTDPYILSTDNSAEKLTNDKATMIELFQQKDVAAMGIVFYCVLSEGVYPFGDAMKQDTFPEVLNFNPYPLMANNVPAEIINLIQEMLNPDYRARLTAEVAFTRLENYLLKSKPDIYQKIQTQFHNQPQVR